MVFVWYPVTGLCVTQRIEVKVCNPAIADDGGAGFEPITTNVNQCVSSSNRNGNKKCPAGFAFNTTKHAMTLNRMPSMILSPSELPLVNFRILVRPTDLFRAALQDLPHGFPAERATVSDGMSTEAIFILDFEGGFAAHDVVRQK
jgi:hypothetical protein